MAFYEQAAALGQASALARLAIVFEKGLLGVEQDLGKASACREQAEAKRLSSKQEEVGHIHEAALNGDKACQRLLAKVYEVGRILPRNPERAEFWRTVAENDIQEPWAARERN